MGKKGARRYSPEFKADAVALVASSGKPVEHIAKELGVHGTSLGNWVRQAAIDAGNAEGLTTDEREELKRLRKDNATLKMEREILKRAEAFWVRESAK